LFISVLRKTGKQAVISERSKRSSDNKLTRDEKSVALDWTFFKEGNLTKARDEVISFPGNQENYSMLSKRLRMISPGTGIFIEKQSRYIPSHELAMSVFLKKNIFPSIELDLVRAISFLRKDSIVPENTTKGWNLISYNGIVLGFVNNIGNRLNNYYPVEWRIRMNPASMSGMESIHWDNPDKVFLK